MDWSAAHPLTILNHSAIANVHLYYNLCQTFKHTHTMTRYQIEQESIRIRNERRANMRSAFILGIGIVGLAFSYAIIMIHFLGQ